MREFKKHRSQRAELLNFSIRLGGAFLLLLITIGAVRGAWDMYGRLSRATVGQQQAEARLLSLEQQHATVSVTVEELSSARGEEALLRQHYGVAKPGEGMVQIVHQASTTASESTTSSNWFSRLFHTLFSW